MRDHVFLRAHRMLGVDLFQRTLTSKNPSFLPAVGAPETLWPFPMLFFITFRLRFGLASWGIFTPTCVHQPNHFEFSQVNQQLSCLTNPEAIINSYGLSTTFASLLFFYLQLVSNYQILNTTKNCLYIYIYIKTSKFELNRLQEFNKMD